MKAENKITNLNSHATVIKEQPKLQIKRWEKAFFGIPIRKIHTLLPGLVIVILFSFVAKWLSELIGIRLMGYEKSPISSVMLALMIGMLLGNLISIPVFFQPGIKFSIKKLLKLGIIFLGIRLSFLDVFKLSLISLPIIILCITGALLITRFLNKFLNQPKRLTTLIAVGTSICGVSAIVATSPVIDAEEEETAYSVAVITIFGLIATISYPILAYYLFNNNAVEAGLWLGTAIHDTSQVTGAAMVYSELWNSPLTLDTASVTKLVRNIFMIIVIPLMSYQYSKDRNKMDEHTQSSSNEDQTFKSKLKSLNLFNIFPKFVFGFLFFSLIRTIGDWTLNQSGIALFVFQAETWLEIIVFFKLIAAFLFIMALFGVGLRTQFSMFKGLGIKPFLIGLSAAIGTGLLSMMLVFILGNIIVL